MSYIPATNLQSFNALSLFLALRWQKTAKDDTTFLTAFSGWYHVFNRIFGHLQMPYVKIKDILRSREKSWQERNDFRILFCMTLWPDIARSSGRVKKWVPPSHSTSQMTHASHDTHRYYIFIWCFFYPDLDLDIYLVWGLYLYCT